MYVGDKKERLAAMIDGNEAAAGDLLEWYNITEESHDDGDLKRLAKLFNRGRFHAWNCPTCGERVRYGEPINWDNFQGVGNPDHTSYPGSPDLFGQKIVSMQCDDCRLRGTLVIDEQLEFVGKGKPALWMSE